MGERSGGQSLVHGHGTGMRPLRARISYGGASAAAKRHLPQNIGLGGPAGADWTQNVVLATQERKEVPRSHAHALRLAEAPERSGAGADEAEGQEVLQAGIARPGRRRGGKVTCRHRVRSEERPQREPSGGDGGGRAQGRREEVLEGLAHVEGAGCLEDESEGTALGRPGRGRVRRGLRAGRSGDSGRVRECGAVGAEGCVLPRSNGERLQGCAPPLELPAAETGRGSAVKSRAS